MKHLYHQNSPGERLPPWPISLQPSVRSAARLRGPRLAQAWSAGCARAHLASIKELAMIEDLYQIADELRAISLLGLRYSANDFDRDRYRRVQAASARIISALDHTSASEVLERFQENLDHVSPVTGAEAIVVRDGPILLIQRADTGLWAMPGGPVELAEPLA